MRSFQTKQSVNKTNVSDGSSKQVTQQNLPQIRKQAVRNTNVIAPGPSRNNPKHVSFQSPKEFVGSNDMVHNYYLEKAKKSAQLQKDKDVNGKPSMIDPARLPNTANGCKPKPRNWQASMSSRVSNKDVHLGEHRKQKPFLKFNDLRIQAVGKREEKAKNILLMWAFQKNNEIFHGMGRMQKKIWEAIKTRIHDEQEDEISNYQQQETGKQEKNQMGLLTMDDGIVQLGNNTEAKKQIKGTYGYRLKQLDNEIYEKDEKLKRYRRIGMKAVKEKEQLQKIVDSWKDSSKNLWRLIDSGMSSNKDSIGKPSYSRFTKTNNFKGVPHPLNGDYTPKPQEEIDDSLTSTEGTGRYGILDMWIAQHMTGNKDQLEDFEEFNGGSVTFGAAITPMETKVPLTKDEEYFDVDVHLYRSMIGNSKDFSSQCCQEDLQVSQGQTKLGLWYPRESPIDWRKHSLIATMRGPTFDRNPQHGFNFLGSKTYLMAILKRISNKPSGQWECSCEVVKKVKEVKGLKREIWFYSDFEEEDLRLMGGKSQDDP
ncbi:hypothetical protein Tco_1066952 [Tanacetum coccineum]|uniref:Uncharacterized protein n=1 Tax=Tanacetum coccineum TaxID=301880 RepID=A0ABQ5HBH2_9ASTR